MRPSDPTTIKLLNDAHLEVLRGGRKPLLRRRPPRVN
jgi:hypothetical protein